MEQTYRSQIFDHLGLVAGMFEALGIGDVIDKATPQNPEMQIVTAGNAVKAMVLNGLGFVNQRLYLVPQCFQNKPTSRLLAPAIAPAHLKDDTRGRALDTLADDGVTALYSLIAATAAQRLGLSPTFAHRDSTSFHVEGRYKSDEEPDDQVIPIPQGDSRDHRPDLNQVRRDLMVEHQAGLPIWMQPLSGNSRDVTDFGQIVQAHSSKLSTTYGTTSLVAESALYSDDTRQKLAETHRQGMPRVPATVHEAQTALAQVIPETMQPLMEGYRDQACRATAGGVPQRWGLLYAELRQPHVQRTVNQQLLTQGDQEVQAFQQLCRVAFACEAEAPQARATCAHGLEATFVHESTVRSSPRYGQRGRPRQDAQPAQVT
jgi:transposase